LLLCSWISKKLQLGKITAETFPVILIDEESTFKNIKFNLCGFSIFKRCIIRPILKEPVIRNFFLKEKSAGSFRMVKNKYKNRGKNIQGLLFGILLIYSLIFLKKRWSHIYLWIASKLLKTKKLIGVKLRLFLIDFSVKTIRNRKIGKKILARDFFILGKTF